MTKKLGRVMQGSKGEGGKFHSFAREIIEATGFTNTEKLFEMVPGWSKDIDDD